MAEKLKIISLGGLNEIGKNLTVYEYEEDIIIVDCGLGFPDDEMYGVDIVIPNFSYLVKNKHKIRGIVYTHGHEDHIGATPYLLRELKCPLYATKLTAGLLEIKLQEHGLLKSTEMHVKKAGDKFSIGCFKIELIHVNHSIADAVSIAIQTPVGMVIQTGDFKIDTTPIQGDMADLTRFGELGKRGVLALLSDSTNVEKPGYSTSERKVGERFDQLFRGCDQRIIVTTFASNIHRIQQIINCSARYGRKVGITGRSMENIMRVSTELGYMKVPENTLVDMSQLKSLPKEKITIITTGSQGESMSSLYRMAFSGHRQVEIGSGDRVIISASAIPGNEKTVSRIIDELFHKGAEVIYDKLADLHVSGHAYQEELKMILRLVKPRYFIPVHGEHRHLKTHAKLAQEIGISSKNILISDIGRVMELNNRGAKITGTVTAGKTLVDGTGVGDVGSVVLRDRRHLAQDGMLVVVLNLNAEDGELLSRPDIITRGFIYVKESEALMDELRGVVLNSLRNCKEVQQRDWVALKATIKSDLSNFLYKKTKRNPMVLPVVMAI